MRIMLLGATGMIGSAVLNELIRAGHSVLALARSDAAEQSISKMEADVLRGDLLQPAHWASAVNTVDAVIHAAATFSDDMGSIDRHVIDALIGHAMMAEDCVRFIYTGGIWLYGATGDEIATEETPFDPIQSFSWMVENGQAVLGSSCFEGLIVHPARVYERDGGAFSRFLSSAQDKGRIEVWGSLETRWPLVHRSDLAMAYRLVLEHGVVGESYNVAAQTGVRVGDIVTAMGRRLGLDREPLVRPVDDVVEEYGTWAVGPTLDQQMSAKKIISTLGWVPQKTDVVAEIS